MKEKCHCGEESIGKIGIPTVQLTESQKVVNLEEGQSSMIFPLCYYHCVLVERGVLKTDGKKILRPEPLAIFERHSNECLIKHMEEKRGEDPEFDKHIIEIILEGRDSPSISNTNKPKV